MAKSISSAAVRPEATAMRNFWAIFTLAFLIFSLMWSAARAAPESFADLVDEVSPAVVSITVTGSNAEPFSPEGTPFEDFFREFERNMPTPRTPPQQQRPSQGLGSGFVITEDGYIVTNDHVISGASEIMVAFPNGDRYEAKLVGTDQKTDIALLKIEVDAPLTTVGFGDSDVMRVGDWVLAVGSPLGQNFSVSAGIVSARNRELSGVYDDFIQTDAAINRGNSGGPLFNMDGEVIGVNTAILSPSGGSIGIGFSMASNVVTKVVDQLMEFGETRRGWLGVRIQNVEEDMAEALGIKEAKGALVTQVPEGPAMDAGIEAGDVILSFDGRDIADTRDLINIVGDSDVGATVRVVVLRNGESKTLLVTLGRRETSENDAFPEAVPAQPQAEPQSDTLMGMELSEISSNMRAEMEIEDDRPGLLVQNVDVNSAAGEKGIQDGDILREAAGNVLQKPSDLADAIAETKELDRRTILLLVERNGNARFVAVAID